MALFMGEIQINKVADLQKVNQQGKETMETGSALTEKRKYILDELSKLMDKASGDYGPFLMEELQRRLEFVVQNFNEELKALITSSFENWKNKDSQLRDLMAKNTGKLQIPKSQPANEKLKNSSTPDFIKDVDFGPLRRK